MVHAGLRYRIGRVWLWLVDYVAGHGGCEHDGAGTVASYDISVPLSSVILGSRGSAPRQT